MKITWLGHAAFRIELADQVLLIDPWLSGNPSFPQDREADAISGCTAILLTHAHNDHAADVGRVQGLTGAKIHTVHELAGLLAARGLQTQGFGLGGSFSLGEVTVSLVPAAHSSSLPDENGVPIYAGNPAGFMIKGEGRTIYVSGDTGIMADMGWMAELYQPDIGILCAGGHYTMDMAQAAFVCRKYFNFRHVIPCHYKTFGALAQNAEELRRGVDPHVMVHETEVMQPILL